ncbi:MAG: hypothetical protein JJE01_12335 [Gemmatimonadetes bacterium]|nr:hypothetical protein [Gemmatimonadota bacterium]
MIVAARNAAVARSEEKADPFRISVLVDRAGRKRTLLPRLRKRFQEVLALSYQLHSLVQRLDFPVEQPQAIFDPLEPAPVRR